MQYGFLQIDQSKDAKGVLYESFSLYPLWKRLTDEIVLEKKKSRRNG